MADCITKHVCAASALFFAFFYQLTLGADFLPYNPTDKILIDCGESSSYFSDIRSNWVGDIDSKFFPSHFHLNNESVALQPADMQFNSADQVPYRTARLSHSQFTYLFPLSPGHKFLRLYFYPARYPNFDRFEAIFSVRIGLYTLLRDFNASSNADASNLDVFFREFCVHFEGNDQNMSLSFIPTNQDSYAFISGIEIVSMPSYLYHTPPQSNDESGRGLKFVGQTNMFFPIENNTFLEMVYRMNIGGKSVSPIDDTGMFRTWSEESNLIKKSSLDARPANISIKLNYTKISPYTAPEQVYRTARTMGPNATENKKYNLTWEYPVDPGFFYMIRLHFCEFQSEINDTSDRVFLIYIKHMIAEPFADVFRWAGGKGSPYYRDYVVLVSSNNVLKKVNLSVELQPNPNEGLTRFSNVILNGVEIFKLNDSSGNLGAQNPDPPGSTMASQSRSSRNKMVAIVSCCCFCLIVVLLYIMVVYIQRKRRLSSEASSTFKKKMMNMESTMNYGPKRYDYSEIKKMTNSFSEKVGEGGYGIVYRGKLENGSLVAVKVLKVSKTDGEDFINEVMSISQTSHVNIVSLLGFSYNSKEIALVYEFMSNGSLDSFISRNHNIEMEIIHRVVVGVAKGLEYLHSGCSTRIVHFDIKPQNILLDGDLNPKISDFGLAKLCKKKESVISMLGLRGTIGFIAPEVFSRAFGSVSYKSDVYSYGMLVLDLIIGGTRNPTSKFLSDDSELHFPSWVFKNFEEGRTN